MDAMKCGFHVTGNTIDELTMNANMVHEMLL